MNNPSAPPGRSERYARRELERRFLLAGPPAGPVEKTARIHDRYIEGTRLRLRKKTDETGVHYKLTQKVPASNGSPGLITTIYFSERRVCAVRDFARTNHREDAAQDRRARRRRIRAPAR